MTTGTTKLAGPKYPVQFFAGLGASVNMFSVKGNVDYINGNYNTQVSPVLEAGLRLFNQRRAGRLFFTLRLNAYQYKSVLHFPGYSYITNSGATTTYQATVIDMPVSLGYKIISQKNLALSFSGGIVALFELANTPTTTWNDNHQTAQTSTARSFAYAFFGEGELLFGGKLAFYSGYYIPCTLVQTPDYIASHSSIKAGLRYFIF